MCKTVACADDAGCSVHDRKCYEYSNTDGNTKSPKGDATHEGLLNVTSTCVRLDNSSL